jgi:hypothetical protein
MYTEKYNMRGTAGRKMEHFKTLVIGTGEEFNP